MILNEQVYREFINTEEAEQWAWKHYADFLNFPPESEIYKTFFWYTGSWYTECNNIMRSIPEKCIGINSGVSAEVIRAIQIMNDVLCSYSLPENVITYRFTHKEDIKKLCHAKRLPVGMTFADSAFLSTTLVKSLLENFGKENHGDCVLKLYLPKGTPGAYVSFNDNRSCLNEQEFLIPPHMRFQITKIHYFTFPLLIECMMVIDKD